MNIDADISARVPLIRRLPSPLSAANDSSFFPTILTRPEEKIESLHQETCEGNKAYYIGMKQTSTPFITKSHRVSEHEPDDPVNALDNVVEGENENHSFCQSSSDSSEDEMDEELTEEREIDVVIGRKVLLQNQDDSENDGEMDDDDDDGKQEEVEVDEVSDKDNDHDDIGIKYSVMGDEEKSEEEEIDDDAGCDNINNNDEECSFSNDVQVARELKLDEQIMSDDERDEDQPVSFLSGKTAVANVGVHVHKPTPVIAEPSGINGSINCHEDRSSSSDDESTRSYSSSSTSSSSSQEGARGLGLALDVSSESESEGGSNIGENESQFDHESENSSLSDDVDENGNESECTPDSENENELKTHEFRDPSEDTKASLSIDLELQNALDNEQEDAVNESIAFSKKGETGRKEMQMVSPRDISLEELEDIINESPKEGQSSNSDLEFSDCEKPSDSSSPETSHKLSDEDITELLADALESDFWSHEKLSSVVTLLSEVPKNADRSTSGVPIHLPSQEDDAFWVDKMLVQISPSAFDLVRDRAFRRSSASKVLHDTFSSELESTDITLIDVKPMKSTISEDGHQVDGKKQKHDALQLYVGSFATIESRLALAVLKIKHIILISFHPLDDLWVCDGVKYSSYILPSVGGEGSITPVCEIVANAATEVASFFHQEDVNTDGISVLVACSTGDEYSCATCALYLSEKFGLDRTTALERIRQLRPSTKVETSWMNGNMETDSTAGIDDDKSPPKPKRVLSFQMLPNLPTIPYVSPKRLRSSLAYSSKRCQGKKDTKSPIVLPPLPQLNLGQSAMERNDGVLLYMRRSTKEISSTDEDEEKTMERHLSEELEGSSANQITECDPVPLLTPPASPVATDNDGTPTICEWPSNLVVDTAMTSAIALRSLSPKSLEKQEEESCKAISFASPCKPSQDKNQKPASSSDIHSGLTPKLEGISVSLR